MKSLKIILICLYLSACQNPQQEKISQDEASNIQLQSDSLIKGNTPSDIPITIFQIRPVL